MHAKQRCYKLDLPPFRGQNAHQTAKQTREGEVISTLCTMQLHIELVAHCVWYIAS